MENKIKYDVKNPKYFDAKHLAEYLAKELKEKDFKIKFEKTKKDNAIGAMTEPVVGKIKVMGNPAKMVGALPDGWTYDPLTNRFKNGNKAEAEYFEVEPLKKGKPLKSIIDMSDAMYMIRLKRPDLRVKALDSTTIGIDGSEIDNIDWKGIFGSTFRFDKRTGTLQGETKEGIKLSFNILTENMKSKKFETVSESSYTANVDGVIERGFSEGNRKSVEETADKLVGEIASLDPRATLMNADLHTFSPSDARFLYETKNLIPNPKGGLAVQDRDTGVIYTDPTLVSQLSIIYSLVRMVDRSGTIEDNPLLDSVTRGDVNWENFDKMFMAFANNPDMLKVAFKEISIGMESGDNAREIREDVKEAVVEEAGETKESSMESSVDDTQKSSVITENMQGVELKNDGKAVNEATIDDDKKPMSYEQLAMLDNRYERITSGDGRTVGAYDERTGLRVDANNRDMRHWLIVKDALDERFGNDENAKAKYWNAVIQKDDWQSVAWSICQTFEAQNMRRAEMEDEDVMVMKKPNNDGANE